MATTDSSSIDGSEQAVIRPAPHAETHRPDRLVRASILYGLSGVFGKAGALLTVPVVTRSLGPADYGLLDLAVSLIGLATIIGGFSAELPTARLITRDRASRSVILTTYVATVSALTGAIAIGMAVLSGPIARDVWLRGDAVPVVSIAAGAVVLTGIQFATWHVHRITNRPTAFAILSVADMALKVGLIWVAAIAGLGAAGVVLVYFVVAGLGALVGLWTTRDDLTLSVMPSVVPAIIRGGALFTVMAVAFVASNYGVRALIASESGGAAVGAMALGLRVASVLALPLRAFQLAWAPSRMAAPQSESSRSNFLRSIVAVLVVGGFAAMALGAFAPEIIRIVAGSDFLSAADAVPGLGMATTLAAAFFMIGVACSVAGTPVWMAGLAAVAGGVVQILVTGMALGSIGTQSAIGTGAVVGQATAIGALVWMSAGRALSQSWRIVALTVVAILAVLALQLMLSAPVAAVRWAVGAGSATVVIVASARAYLAHARAQLVE